jgi:hypothetical protein
MPAALTITGNSNDALAAIAALERKYDALEAKMKALGDKSKKQNGESLTQWEQMTGSAAGFVSEISGIEGPLDMATKAIELFKAEWDDLIERQGAAKDATLQFAVELQKAANNSDTSLAEVKQRMLDISNTAKITPLQAAELLNVGQAAKGTLDESAVDKTIVAAAKLARLDEETMKGLVDTGLDLQKQIPGTTAEQAIGFSLGAMAKTRIADAGKFTQNALPGIISVASLDNTPIEFVNALNAGITQASGDQEGRKSRTAMTALALQLRDAFPELENTESRVRALQDNPELRDAFLKGGKVNGKKLSGMQFEVKGPDGEVLQLDTDRASFERQMIPAMEQVLTRGTFGSNMMEEALRDVPKLAEADQAFAKRVADQESDTTMRLATKQAIGDVGTEMRKINDTGAASDAIDRQILEDRLKAGGVGAFNRTLIMGDASFNGYWGGDYNKAITDRLQAEIESTEKWSGDEKHIELMRELIAEIKAGRVEKAKVPLNPNGNIEQ